MPNIGNDWDTFLAPEFKKEYYLILREFLKQEYAEHTIYPDMYNIFNAIKLTSYENTKAVILGQDPYINANEAHGLSFSVQKGTRIPPSLMNIFKELHTDIGTTIPNHGCLEKWATEGVLLLNAVLTVRAKQSNSHKNKGWEHFTDRIIEVLNQKQTPVAFLLWGNNAKAKAKLITNPNHLILQAAHPSPLANGAFFGCKHFSKTNQFLLESGQNPIDWQIE